MSIFAQAPIIPRHWRGYDEPGLPVATYISHQVVVGDLSGGVMEIHFQFKTSGTSGAGRLFSIEQISSHLSLGSAIVGYFKAVGFESVAGFVVGERIWPMTYVPISVDSTAAQETLVPKLPLFLGQTSPVQAINSDFEVGLQNISVVTLQAVIQGYIWEPRSLLVDGGLRRPVESIYGR